MGRYGGLIGVLWCCLASAQPMLEAGQAFQDCETCPVMVVIPAGGFEMGMAYGDAIQGDEESPTHPVRFSRSFALGEYEVTRGQFEAFVKDAGYDAGDSCFIWNGNTGVYDAGRNWRRPGFDQDDHDPVICVNWEDAQAYVAWLSHRTGKRYRLPSEAEWEYACRGGGQDTYCGGEDVDALGWYRQNSGSHTHSVGQKQANGYGLYDMSGNVWEWTEDCYHGSYAGAPGDGSAWTEGDCRRVLRGGSWFNEALDLRAVFRLDYSPGSRYFSFGFRVARTLS